MFIVYKHNYLPLPESQHTSHCIVKFYLFIYIYTEDLSYAHLYVKLYLGTDYVGLIYWTNYLSFAKIIIPICSVEQYVVHMSAPDRAIF